MEFYNTLISILLYTTTLCYVVRTRMLKITECGIYDAEFSVFKRNYRFKANIIKRIQVNAIHECAQGCTVYPDCFSYNFQRNNKTCEYVNTTTKGFKQNIGNLEKIGEWTYYETKHKKALGQWCETNNPCKSYERCEDRCYGHECISLMFELSGVFHTDYGPVEICPTGEKPIVFATRTEQPRSSGDETAMNAISFMCSSGNGEPQVIITSFVGPWGYWESNAVICEDGFVAARLKVQPAQASGKDDTATNSIQLQCKSGEILEASNGGPWGEWMSWGHCPAGTTIIGLQTMVQPYQNSGDDTALNSVKFFCG